MSTFNNANPTQPRPSTEADRAEARAILRRTGTLPPSTEDPEPGSLDDLRARFPEMSDADLHDVHQIVSRIKDSR